MQRETRMQIERHTGKQANRERREVMLCAWSWSECSLACFAYCQEFCFSTACPPDLAVGYCGCRSWGPLCWEVRAMKGPCFKAWVGENINSHAWCACCQQCLPFSHQPFSSIQTSFCFFPNPSSPFLLALDVAHAGSYMGLRNETGLPACC